MLRVEQARFERGEAPLVVAVHALRHVLERAHGLFARLALEEADVGELEQRDRRREALRRARAEQLPRLVEHEQRASSCPSYAEPANAEPARLAERRAAGSSRANSSPTLAEVDELSAGANRDALAARQVVERRVERDALDVAPIDGGCARRSMLAPRVEASGARAARSGRLRPAPRRALDERGVAAGGDGECVSE